MKTAKDVIRLTREAGVSLFLWGIHGIGKSAAVRQTADELGIQFIDCRCAQIEASDLRGLPDKGSDGRTHYLAPVDLPSSGDGVLFLDELNRANNEVLAAAFQLVLDRRIGQYRLPPGWSVVAAGNVDSGDYHVTELDPAFLDRFCHVQLAAGQPTFPEWADWLSRKYPDQAMEVLDFCGSNLTHLESDSRPELGFQVTPSRRAWELVVRVLQVCEQRQYGQQVRLETVAGLIGRDLAISFLNHRAQLSPLEILSMGVSAWADQIGRMTRNQKMALMWGMISHGKRQLHDAKVAEVILDFGELLFSQEKDLAIALCDALLAESEAGDTDLSTSQRMALLANPRLAAAVSRVNRGHKRKPEFVDHLVTRPRWAGAIAQAMSVVPCSTPEEVSP